MELLLLLVERKGELVTREEIVERIWGKDVFLDTDNSINGAVSRIRQVLRDNPEQPRFVQTVTGKGYRFIAQIEEDAPATGVIPMPATVPESTEPIAAPSSKLPDRVRWWWPSLLAISIFLIAALAAYFQWWRSAAHHAQSNGRAMLAVLPFENLTGDPSQDYFSDGMTEELIAELGSLNPTHFGVIARTSVMLYKRSPKPLDQVGHELGVQYVVEGSVRRDAGHVRVTAQLIKVRDQTHLWAAQYDRDLTELLVLQSEIARDISEQIQATLGTALPLTPVSRPALSPVQYEAHDLYLKGRYFWNKRTNAGFLQAAQYFQQAIAKDPDYAQAYAGLADTYALMSTWSLAPQVEFMPKARVAALRALELDGTLSEAHTSMGLIAEAYDYDWQAAEREFRRAIELNPDYATAHQWYAEYLCWHGRFDEALAESERARQLDPLSVIIASDYAAILYDSRQYDRAIAQWQTVLEMDPSDGRTRAGIAFALMEEGKFADALALEEQTDPPGPWNWAYKAYLYNRWGRTTEARQAQAKFAELAPKLAIAQQAWLFVLAYGGTEQQDDAIALLQKVLAAHSYNPGAIKVDPRYDPLRNDPRFQDLMRRLGLAQ